MGLAMGLIENLARFTLGKTVAKTGQSDSSLSNQRRLSVSSLSVSSH